MEYLIEYLIKKRVILFTLWVVYTLTPFVSPYIFVNEMPRGLSFLMVFCGGLLLLCAYVLNQIKNKSSED